MDFQRPDDNGYYGQYGGAYIPELLYKNVEDLKNNYMEIIEDNAFQKEYHDLLRDYVGRPSPLYFAKNLSQLYNTNVYLKREDLNHTGAHKINNTIGQILIAEKMGKKRIIAETGAGQHGVATATVCALKGLECIVYMGAEDVHRQAPNVARMKMLGAKVVAVTSGSKALKDATNAAIREWINNADNTYYLIGSAIGPHPYPDMVTQLQAVISREIKEQLIQKINRDYPSHLIACVGGGSNAIGCFYEYLNDDRVSLMLAEAAGLGVDSGKTAATSIKGRLGIIHGCKTLLMQNDDGQITEPYSLSAGLDYPGIGPAHANLIQHKRASVIAVTDDEALKAVLTLSQKEGIIPALESAHALAVLDKKTFNHDDVVIISLSGRGDKDLNTYLEHFNL